MEQSPTLQANTPDTDQRGPTLTVRNVTAEKHKDEASNVKYSGFLITLSTNYKPKTTEESQAMGARLNSSIAAVFATHAMIATFIKFLTAGHSYARNIKSVDMVYAIELGKGAKGGRIHAHIILKIKHNSMIRVDIPAFKEAMLAVLNENGATPQLTSLYVNVRIIRSDQNLEEYLLKKEVSVSKPPTADMGNLNLRDA